jgi:putative hydrolase of the HAD superfamily
MINAVIFDLDGTLFDRDSSVRDVVAAQYDAFVEMHDKVERATFVAKFIELDRRGYVPKEQVYPDLLQAIGISEIPPDRLVEDYFARYHHHCRLFPSARETLELLQARDVRLGIITNGGFPFQLRTVKALTIEHFFSTILVSAEEGIKKPNPLIFWRAAARLGIAPEEAVFVGDHPVVDVEGARGAGLRAIWKRDNFWQLPAAMDGEIDDLNQLLDLIHGLELP